MITLTLLHPIQSIPVQSWSFEHESVIRIGRSTDNHVILYSAVVSRHHVEIRKSATGWEIFNLGANGTYLDGKRITQVPVEDGVIIRLARSGPNVQIHVGRKVGETVRTLSGEKTIAQREGKASSLTPSSDSEEQTEITRAAPRQSSGPDDRSQPPPSPPPPHRSQQASGSAHPAYSLKVDVSVMSGWQPRACCDRHSTSELVFCPECGQPLRVLQTLGDYCVIRELQRDVLYISYLVWRRGQSLTLRTLTPEWLEHPTAIDIFQQEAQQLSHLRHPGLPCFLDMFAVGKQPCLVMDPVYGQTLQQVVETNSPIAPSQAIHWILQVCDLLAYLHQQDLPVIHGDLHPSHLIRRPAAVPQHDLTVVGFSACKQLAIDPNPSLSYAAPERYRGQLYPSSDLYSLGIILVYLLTGQSPEAFYDHYSDGVRFYPEFVPGLATEFLPIVNQLIHPNPSYRYQSATDVATDLRQLSLVEVPSSMTL